MIYLNDKIGRFYLDEQQQAIVIDDSKYLLVVAGAGSGKTLTILGKIHYLVKYKNILPEEILCISFTRAASTSLKEKIKKDLNITIEVYTFHKLSLEILKKCNYQISESNLLETLVDEFFENYILNSNYHLKLFLNYFNIYNYDDVKECYLNYIKSHEKELKSLKRLIITFIHLFKCNNYKLENFNNFLIQAKKEFLNIHYKKEKALLIIILNVYIIYEKYLKNNNEIDFDDMISLATNMVQTTGFNRKIKYIIIDEYQDTSLIRFLLIKEIIIKTKSNLLVVGDDFQSIYRFTGCDLSLFLNFQNYFDNSKIMKIENTYRNSQELISIAGDFIMKNHVQINKKLCSNKHMYKPIKLVIYRDIKKTFTNLVLKIFYENRKPILILGRNNNDVKLILDDNWYIENNKIVYKLDKTVNIYYLTIHKSKGLEEENVIILNLKDDIIGFPSKIKNHRIMRFIVRDYEKYPYAEERRLFYVALTRTKNDVYLLVPRKDKSIFVLELLRDFRKKIEIIKNL